MEISDIEQESVGDGEAREARTLQNNLAPIARLPPEILADIFVQCVPLSIRKLQNDLSWLNVTRICSRWRSVALASPELWSTIICSRPRLARIMMERAKLAPLVVRVDLGRHLAYSPESLLCEYAPRVGVLDIRSPQYYLATFVSNLRHAEAAPRLQDIKIVNTDEDNLGEGGMWLPSNLFHRKEVLEGWKPRVRSSLRLHLESCAFPWDSGWYTGLTHLHLENINPAQAPTMEAFLAILVGSPALQTLSLIYCSPSTRRGFAVILPHLAALTIKSDSPWTCACLLGYLIIPPSAILKVAVYCNSKSEHEHDIHMTLVPKFFSPCTYDTVRIIHEPSPTYLLLDSARPHWSRRLRIYADTWSRQSVATVTEAFILYLDTPAVTSLHLHSMAGVCKGVRDVVALCDLWDLAGQRLRCVRMLHVHDAVPTALLEFLLTQAVWLLGVSSWKACLFGFYPPKSRLHATTVDGMLTHAWPALRRVRLSGVNLGGPRAADAGVDPWGDASLAPSRADMLRALLWARREGGARLWQLELEGCTNLFRLDLSHLRLFVDVVWDGTGEMLEEKEDAGLALREYSLDVFANMIEYVRSWGALSL